MNTTDTFTIHWFDPERRKPVKGVVRVSVDLAKIACKLAYKAHGNKGKKATGFDGCIVVDAIGEVNEDGFKITEGDFIPEEVQK